MELKGYPLLAASDKLLRSWDQNYFQGLGRRLSLQTGDYVFYVTQKS